MDSIPAEFFKSLLQHQIRKRKDLLLPKWSITVSDTGIQASIIWGKLPATDRSSQSPKWSIKKCAAPTKLIIKKEYSPIPRNATVKVTPVVKDPTQQLSIKNVNQKTNKKSVTGIEIPRQKRATEEKNEVLCFVKAVKAEIESPKRTISLDAHEALLKASRKRKSESERKIAKKRTETSGTEETINLIELDEDETFKQEYVEEVVETHFENEIQNLTIEKIAASKGLSGALHELQLDATTGNMKLSKAVRQYSSIVFDKEEKIANSVKDLDEQKVKLIHQELAKWYNCREKDIRQILSFRLSEIRKTKRAKKIKMQNINQVFLQGIKRRDFFLKSIK